MEIVLLSDGANLIKLNNENQHSCQEIKTYKQTINPGKHTTGKNPIPKLIICILNRPVQFQMVLEEEEPIFSAIACQYLLFSTATTP